MTTSPTSFCVTVAGFGTAFVTLNIAVSEVKIHGFGYLILQSSLLFKA